MKSFYVAASDGISLAIQVRPGSSRAGLVGISEGRLRVKVCARAVEGQANEALCDFLSDLLRLPKSCVTITRGERSRDKTVFIKADPQVVLSKLNAILNADQGT